MAPSPASATMPHRHLHQLCLALVALLCCVLASVPSSPSLVTSVAAQVGLAPVILTVQPHDGSALVKFQGVENAQRYAVTRTDSLDTANTSNTLGTEGSSEPILVTGLGTDRSYTFKVIAQLKSIDPTTNQAQTSPYSAATPPIVIGELPLVTIDATTPPAGGTTPETPPATTTTPTTPATTETASGAGTPITISPSQTPNRPTADSVGQLANFISPNGDMHLTWQINKATQEIYINMTALTGGYVAFGIGQDHTVNKADFVLGGVSNTDGQAYLYDMWGQDTANIRSDTSFQGTNDVKLLTATQGVLKHSNQPFTTVLFSRKLNTGDAVSDNPIVPGDLHIDWAYHPEDCLNPDACTMHTVAGSVRLDMFNAPLGAPSILYSPSTAQTRFVSPDGAYQVQWTVDPARQFVDFEIQANTLGFVGLGVSNTQSMMQADLWVGWVEDAEPQKPHLLDMFALANGLPTPDELLTDTASGLKGVNNLQLISASQSATQTTMKYRRAIQTGDPYDHALDAQDMNLLWSYGSSDCAQDATTGAFTCAHHVQQGRFSVSLWDLKVAPDESLNHVSSGALLAYTMLAILLTWSSARWGLKWYKQMAGKNLPESGMHGIMTSGGQSNGMDRKGSMLPPSALTSSAEDSWRASWQELVSDDGKVYYYNMFSVGDTPQTAWEIPPMPSDWNPSIVTGHQSSTTQQDNSTNSSPSMSSKLTPRLVPQQSRSAVSPKGKGVPHQGRQVMQTRLAYTEHTVVDAFIMCSYVLINLACAAATSTHNNLASNWGHIAACNALLIAFPSTRNSVLVWLLGLSFDRVIAYHRLMGRWLLLAVSIHMFSWIARFNSASIALSIITQDKHYVCGLVGYIFLWLINILSVEPIRRWNYDVFYYSHFIFIIFYAMIWSHAPAHLTPYTITLLVVYSFDRAIRLFWGIRPQHTTSMQVKQSSLVKLTLPRNAWAAKMNLYRTGQYLFVNFPKISKIEWHPFTISNGPDEDEIELHVRGAGNFTRSLMAHICTHPNEPLSVRCDGPYGELRLNTRRYTGLLLVAGGIGLTPVLSIVRDIYRTGSYKSPEALAKVSKSSGFIENVYIVWVIPDESMFHWFAEELEQCYQSFIGNNLNLSSTQAVLPILNLWCYITRGDMHQAAQLTSFGVSNFQSGRPDFSGILDVVTEQNAHKAVQVFACGPKMLVHQVQDATAAKQQKNSRLDFASQTFDW